MRRTQRTTECFSLFAGHSGVGICSGVVVVRRSRTDDYKHPSLFLPRRRFAGGLVTATATEEEHWAHVDPFLLPMKTLPHCRRQSNEALPELLHLLDKNFTHCSRVKDTS